MNPPDPPDPYKDCCFYAKNVCGSWKHGRVLLEGLINLIEIEKNTLDDFFRNNLHSKEWKNCQWNEKKLIENRAGLFLSAADKICQYHRFTFGTHWQPSKLCVHDDHKGQKTRKKGPKTYTMPLPYVNELNNQSPFECKVGSKMCRNHLMDLKRVMDEKKRLIDEKKRAEEAEKSANESSFLDNSLENESITDHDESFQPQGALLNESADENFEAVQNLCSTFCVTPVKSRFGITKPLEDLSSTQLGYFKRKREEFVSAAASFFDASVAPGQNADAVKSILNLSEENSLSDDMKYLVECYERSDSFGKMAILSTVNHDDYSKENIMEIFGCSRYKVDQARKMKSREKGVNRPENTKFRRTRLNAEKAEHFIQFLFSSGLMQDVAYGATTIKFDSGDSQSVPHAILQSKFSHTIRFYLDVCENIGFAALSESSLWRILRAIKPSQRKSLAGLDDITADGMNGFESIRNIMIDLKCGKQLLDNLEKAKRYLKMSYQAHCSTTSNIVTHNTSFALSKPKEETCAGVSDEVCADCLNVFQVLQEVKDIVAKTSNQDLIYDVDVATKSIIAYMKHQIRDEQQKQAKIYCFEQISNTTAFWLRDYSQKVLPRSYREGTRSYFGKKGMSMHMDIFYTKQMEELVKQVYVTLVYRCDQSKVDTMNIASFVLQQFQSDFPLVNAINGKSDNASSYHGNQILENLYFLCKTRGFRLLRYDYNEPCRGKDQCDRESSGAKNLINSFVESGNNLLCAHDIYLALHYGRGMSNAKAGVIEIDSGKSTLSGQEISGINSYHSAEFFENEMKLYRYYGIGSGRSVKYAAAKFNPEYTVKHDFDITSSHSKTKVTATKKSNTALFFCPEPSCTEYFHCEKEYEKHILGESHTSVSLNSSLDNVKASFVKKMKVSSTSHQVAATKLNISDMSLSAAVKSVPLFAEVTTQGWAIPTVSTFRYSYPQKKFLYDIFMDGQISGKKSSPDEVELSVRQHFTSTKDYVTSRQIRSLFSNFTKKLKENTLKEPTPPLLTSSGIPIPSTDECDVDDDNSTEDADVREDELSDVTHSVIGDISTWDVGTWVVIRHRRMWLPGRIAPKEDVQELHVDNDCYAVDCMERRQRANKFKWPIGRSLRIVHKNDILLEIESVTPLPETEQLTTGEVVWCALTKDDLEDANHALRKALREDLD